MLVVAGAPMVEACTDLGVITSIDVGAVQVVTGEETVGVKPSATIEHGCTSARGSSFGCRLQIEACKSGSGGSGEFRREVDKESGFGRSGSEKSEEDVGGLVST